MTTFLMFLLPLTSPAMSGLIKSSTILLISVPATFLQGPLCCRMWSIPVPLRNVCSFASSVPIPAMHELPCPGLIEDGALSCSVGASSMQISIFMQLMKLPGKRILMFLDSNPCTGSDYSMVHVALHQMRHECIRAPA